jgi:AcrR family transcriptional regulator
MPPRTAPRAEQRERMLAAARRLLEDEGPEALQARRLAAELGTSTQAVYTLFGGMPGLFEAIVAEGFLALADHVKAVPLTDDPVADFFAEGAAYAQWALGHPQLYRLMFGLGRASLRPHFGLEISADGGRRLATFPEGQVAAEVMVHALDRVKAAGRIGDVDTVIAAGQFLSATHGYVLLEIGGAFGDEDQSAQVLAPLGVNLMVGLGDERRAAERSLAAALAS